MKFTSATTTTVPVLSSAVRAQTKRDLPAVHQAADFNLAAQERGHREQARLRCARQTHARRTAKSRGPTPKRSAEPLRRRWATPAAWPAAAHPHPGQHHLCGGLGLVGRHLMPGFFLMVLALPLLWWRPQIVTSLPSRM